MDIQDQRDYEILSNPELQRTESNPSEVREICRHDMVYKTLATVGDFTCRIWYYNDDYDSLSSTEGTKRIHIVPTESDFIEDYSKWLDVANDNWSEGVIFVNPIIRLNGTTFPNNKDLKDCVKYISGVANHYGASKDKIISIDPLDGDKMYEMNYDVTSAKTYSDVSNNIYSDFISNFTSGTVSLNYDTSFSSGSIGLGAIKTLFSGNNNIGSYYRGGAIANISQNNLVPTSGQIKFSNLRNVVSKVTAEANGNWTHLQARYEIFGDTIYQSNLHKTLNINGNVGSASNGDPAIRFNSGGNGIKELNVNNANGGGGGSAGAAVRGYSGNSGGSNGGGGGDGGPALVASSNVRIPTSHYNNRIKGGGGGGGGGGKGGTGGGGGHGGGRRCGGWFCGGTYRVCYNNGGAGGGGGAGGTGGRGNGYYWDPSNGWWVDPSDSGTQNGNTGSGGSGGSSRSGGTGGQGGTGGNGGNFEAGGATGGTGLTGNNGGGDQEGCGYHSSGQSGKAGSGGGGGGGGSSKASGQVTTT